MEFFTHLPMLTAFAFTLMLTLVLPSLMERLRLPGPVGYILAGIILGPQILAVLNPDGKIVQFFADIGKLLLMFFAGYEVDLDQFNRARRKALTFGLATFSAPFLLGVCVALAMGYSPNACAVIGAVLASHTLLGLPIIKQAGLMGRESVVATVGATVFTDLLAIFVLAVCLPIHVSGFNPRDVLADIGWLAVYVPAVLIGLSWIAKQMLGLMGKSKANRALIMLVVMAVAAQGAELIGLEGIIGAFLSGVALKRAFGNTPADDSLEVMGQTLFIPIFFVAAGFLVDFKVFFCHAAGPATAGAGHPWGAVWRQVVGRRDRRPSAGVRSSRPAAHVCAHDPAGRRDAGRGSRCLLDAQPGRPAADRRTGAQRDRRAGDPVVADRPDPDWAGGKATQSAGTRRRLASGSDLKT